MQGLAPRRWRPRRPGDICPGGSGLVNGQEICGAGHGLGVRSFLCCHRSESNAMSSTEFFSEARRLGLKLNLSGEGLSPVHTLDNEALFQLPLLAMTILAISKGRSKPDLPEIGQLVGECLERTVAGFKGSSQAIGWSG